MLRCLLVLAFSLLLLSPAQGGEVVIGDDSFSLPPPAGFSPVNEAVLRARVADANTQVSAKVRMLGWYIPDELLSAPMDALPGTPYCSVQIETAMEKTSVTPASFKNLKALVTNRIDQFQDQSLEATAAGAKWTEPATGVVYRSVTLLPPHVDLADRFSYCVLCASDAPVPGTGLKIRQLRPCTITLLLVRDKVICLIVTGRPEDLGGSRAVAAAWAGAIVAANPPSTGASLAQLAGSAALGSRLVWATILVAAVAALVFTGGVVVFFLTRRKAPVRG